MPSRNAPTPLPMTPTPGSSPGLPRTGPCPRFSELNLDSKGPWGHRAHAVTHYPQATPRGRGGRRGVRKEARQRVTLDPALVVALCWAGGQGGHGEEDRVFANRAAARRGRERGGGVKGQGPSW